MKAITFTEYGPAENLSLSDLPQPKPEPNEVLVRVTAAGVNPADSNLRSGRFRLFLRLKLPFVPGSDIAGVIESVGESVADFEPGQKVFAMIPFNQGGGYAEFTRVDSSFIAPIPDNLSFKEAASIPLAGLTALQALEKAAPQLSGQSILINGASGGVGTLAIQIAKARGGIVTAVCSARNLEFVKTLGADEVIDYNSASWLTHSSTYDIVLDAAAVFTLRDGLKLTRRHGAFVSLNPGFSNPLFRLVGLLRGRRVGSLMVSANGLELHQLGTMLASGKIKPCIDRAYALVDASKAHHFIDSKRARGKVVLEVMSK